MTAWTHADPALPTTVGDAGSRRPRVLPVLVVGVLLAATVRAFLVESYVVPTAALAPTVQPGERVLLRKVGAPPQAGDLVVVDTTGAVPDRSTPTGDGVVGRVLAAVADAVGVRPGSSDDLAVVASVEGDVVRLAAPRPLEVPAEDVVGVVFGRVWPPDRLGSVTGVTS
ncbi:MAG TPA: S26 family signal peptidase [Phycicoccus sp.]